MAIDGTIQDLPRYGLQNLWIQSSLSSISCKQSSIVYGDGRTSALQSQIQSGRNNEHRGTQADQTWARREGRSEREISGAHKERQLEQDKGATRRLVCHSTYYIVDVVLYSALTKTRQIPAKLGVAIAVMSWILRWRRSSGPCSKPPTGSDT